MIRLTLVAVSCLAWFDGPSGAPGPEPSYERMKADAGRDPASQVKLALWCEAHGLESQKLRHLAVAVLADPSNAMAHGLMGLVEFGGKWRRPEAVAAAVKADPARADLLAEYAGRRLRTPVKTEPQWKLALWCEEKGLRDEARAHLATVVRLDPNHAEAWRKLGYKKVNHRWMAEADAARAKAEKDTQQAADRTWQPRLTTLRDGLSHSKTRADAERDLATIAESRAVPMVWKVFVDSRDKHHVTAVQLLGQIDAIESSRALATLALFDRSDQVRRRAAETLRRRDPREWADLPIGLIRSKIKYEVKPVGGPGSPGELYVEGKKANFKRIYRASDLPTVQPGDQFGYDAQGRLIAVRRGPVIDTGIMYVNNMSPDMINMAYQYAVANPNASLNPSTFSSLGMGPGPGTWNVPVFTPVAPSPGSPGRGTALMNHALAHSPLANQGAAMAQMAAAWFPSPITYKVNYVSGGSSAPFGDNSKLDFVFSPTLTIPVEQMTKDAQRTAVLANEQLDADVAALDGLNRAISQSNARAVALLSGATGLSFGDDRTGWEKWFVNQVGYAAMTPDEKPTIVENAVLYQSAMPMPGTDVLRITRMSCFGKGTPVRTLSGSRPIEALQIGDLVLTQDTNSGKLGYRPITVVHHNPPSPTYNISLGDDTIVSSHFHRFWVVGRGWVMARDLKEGEPVRTLGGIAKVAKIEPGAVQPVFNLDVADDADFFAGDSAALVHDNSLPDLKQQPFDAPQAFASK